MELSKDEERIVNDIIEDSLMICEFNNVYIPEDSPEAIAFKKAVVSLCTSQRRHVMGQIVNILV